MRRKIIGIFVVGILLLTGFASIPSQAGPALQPLTAPDPQIIDMIQQVNESLLYYYDSHLTAFGPHATGTETNMKVSQYIYDEFQAMGLSVKFHNWTLNNFTDRNVVATLPGTDASSNAIFIMCAHHDTGADSPGAEDDGSGVSAVLATAKILSQYSFNYTIRFITFSGEEQEFYGSYMYARDVYQQGDNIIAVIDLDEIGYASTTVGGRILDFYVPERCMWIGDFAQTVSTLYRNQTNRTSIACPHLEGASDYQTFVYYGYDAAMIVNREGPSPWYHTQNDNLEHVNWTYCTKITKLVLAVIVEFASTPIELQVMITKPYPGYLYVFNNLLRPLDFWKIWHYPFPMGTTFIFGRTNVNVDVNPSNDILDVIFSTDGWVQEVQSGNASHYEWTIHSMKNIIGNISSPLIGRYIVEVYVYTQSGKVASDAIDTFLFTL